MAFGERISFFRNLRGMTQKYLGLKLGFSQKYADTRVAHYETERRTPKEDLVEQMAEVLDVSPHAITVPDIDSYVGLMHTLFAVSDTYCFKIDDIEGELCITLDKSKGQTYVTMYKMLLQWKEKDDLYKAGKITKEEYDQWRYNYPKYK